MTATDLTADLFFVSALRAGGHSSFTRLRPLADQSEPLAPHGRFAQRILLALQALGYIAPELSFSWAEDWLYARDWISRGFENVGWRVLRPPLPAADAIETWAEGTDPTRSILEMWLGVWEELALAEVAEYARWSLAQSGFNPNWANEASAALQLGIDKFSVSQVMYLVHIALRSLALEHQRASSRINKLGHLFASSIYNYVQRAHSERWTIRAMMLPPDLPRSAISTLFAETVTGLGERYYTHRPCLDALSESIMSRQTFH